MASVNRKSKTDLVTHEGGPSRAQSNEESLRRSVMSCLLWEDQFYENGEKISDRIKTLIPQCNADFVANLAVEARQQMNLRHAPLLLLREMARLKTHKHLVAATLPMVVTRADELTEFLSMYWLEGKCPISAQVKKGLAAAFQNFSAYELAKYNRDKAVKLKDVLFLVHAKPKDEEQASVWKKLIDKELEAPDTWEVALSAGANKKETFERLIKEKKLGGMALLRNLRNMKEASVDPKIMKDALLSMRTNRILPFRFIAAARYAMEFEPQLEEALFKSLEGIHLKGRTVVLVDVSGSMDSKVSGKSEMMRTDAACGLAMILGEVCEEAVVLSFSDRCLGIPPRRGFALRDAILGSQPHGGTRLGESVAAVNIHQKYDRLIVITDEQSADRVPAPLGRGYVLNVGSYENGISNNQWTTISGWSDSVVSYIVAMEKQAGVV